jgi:hypothetical protein
MQGLESIALAVAHLEQERQTEALPMASRTSEETEDNTYPSSVLSSPVMPPPPRHGFGDGQPRLVSSGSIYSQDQRSPTAPVPQASSPSPTFQTDSPWSHLSAAAPPASSPAASPTASMNVAVPANPSLATLLPIPEGSLPPPPPPSEIITQILEHDVLCGRGGETNHHTGNIKYRQLVKCYQPLYIASKRRDKPRIAQTIVQHVRQNGGRFLKKQGNTWRDVGNTKAREKTSQALREGAPELRNPEKEEKPNPPHPIATMSSNNVPTTRMVASPPAHYLSTAATMNHLMAPPMAPPARVFSSLLQAPVLLSSSPPSMVERRHSADSEMSPSGSKRPRRASSSLADLASCAAQLVEPSAPPSSCAAIISADDEDRQEAPAASIIRGPRLKRLKKRLEEFHA